MTNQEQNRDIKRLYKQFKKRTLGNTTNWSSEDWKKYEEEHKSLKKEFTRLYFASDTFKKLNKNSVLILIKMNLSLRIIPLHQFGLNIEL